MKAEAYDLPWLRRVLRRGEIRPWLADAVDAVFDRWYGIATLPDTWTPAISAERVGYYPLSYRALRRIAREMAAGPDDVLYDIGCGKGRPLCVLAGAGFARCVGIEENRRLAGIAQANAEAVRFRRAPIEVRMAQAADCDFAGGTVFLLYNPFGPRTLRRVLDRIAGSVASQPRRIRIFYAHPEHENVLRESVWVQAERDFDVPFQVGKSLRVAVWRN